MARWVKFRTGIVEHVESGRMSPDEYAVYTMLILLADWRTGIWFGSASRLAKIFHWSPRQCQRLLKSLRVKSYISGIPARKGAYSITIKRYFCATGESLIPRNERLGNRTSTTVEATLKEVEVRTRSKEEECPRCGLSFPPIAFRRHECRKAG